MESFQPSHEPQPDQKCFFSKALTVLSYPVALATGWWTAKISVSDSVYNRLKIDGGLEDIRNPFLAERRNLTTAARDGQNAEAFAEASLKADKAYFRQVEERVAKLGLKPFWKQWSFVHRSDKQKAFIHGFKVSSLTLGALLIIANSRTVAQFFDPEPKPRQDSPSR